MSLIPGYIAHIREEDKVIQSVAEHLWGTAYNTQKFAARIGLGSLGYIMGLGHDLCKSTQQFLNYILSCNQEIDSDAGAETKQRGKIDHSTGGAQYVYRNLSVSSPVIAQVAALAMASHHGGMKDCIAPDGEKIFFNRMRKADELTRLSEALSAGEEIMEELNAKLLNPNLISECKNALAALREPEDSQETLLFKRGLLTRFLLSCLIDADRLDTADFMDPRQAAMRKATDMPNWDTLIDRLEAKLSSFADGPINALRTGIALRCLEAASKPPGIFKLCVPTGGGKTLASLRLALHHAKEHELDRILYVVPFTSIIEQNAQVVRALFAGLPNVEYILLEHHSDLSLEERSVKQRLLSENWNAPIVFTTMVQFLNALFDGGTKSPRRMHALANSVVIFDEIQALPIKCVEMFNVAIRFLTRCCGTTAVLCTATQPLLDCIDKPSRAMPKNAYSIIPDPDALHASLRRTTLVPLIKDAGWKTEEVAELVRKELSAGNSVLAVVNTKASARDLYAACASFSAKVYHLSTDMCPQHRLDTLEEIRQNLTSEPQVPTVCVSTALIEAGVDVDFGTVVRYLAGLDSVVQAAGRCNRNGKRDIGRVYLVNAAREHLSMLPEIRKGQECTLRVLGDFKRDPAQLDSDLLSPRALEQYYAYYFFDRRKEMCYPFTRKSALGYDGNLFDLLSVNNAGRSKAGDAQLPLPQAFKTANDHFCVIDQHTQGVIVPYGKEGKRLIAALCGLQDFAFAGRLLIQAQRYTVNIYAQTFRILDEAGAVHEVQKDTGVFYLDEGYYDPQFGLSKEGGPMPTQTY